MYSYKSFTDLFRKYDLGNDALRESDTFLNNRRILVAIVLFLFYLKSLSFLLNPQFWAEDGPIFFSDAWSLGLHSILKPQAGYYVLTLRIIAFMSTLLPLAFAPLICGLATLILTAFPVYLILSKRSDSILPGLTSKLVFALLYLVGPASLEIYGNLTNLQWFLPVWTILFIFSTQPASRVVRTLEYAFLVLACLTGPFVIFIFPIYVVLLLFKKARFDYTTAAILGLTFALQVYAVMTSPQASGDLSVSMLLKYISSKIALNGLFGIRGQRLIFVGNPNAFFLLIGGLLWFYSSARIMLTGSAFTRVILVFSNLIFVAGCRKFANYFSMDPEVGARYAWLGVVSYLYFYHFIAARTPFRIERWTCYTLLLLGLIVAIPLDWNSFNAKNIDWKHEVRSFRWLDTGDTLRINTDPVPWYFTIVKNGPSEIRGTEESNDINSIVSLQVQNDRIKTTDAWAFIQNESSNGNQLFLVLKSADDFYVFPSEPQFRPEVSQVYKQDYNWSGFTISRSIAHTKEGKYSLGLFIFNSRTKRRSLKYLTHDFEITHSGDLNVPRVWNL